MISRKRRGALIGGVIATIALGGGGIAAATMGTASAAQDDEHGLVVQRVWNHEHSSLVTSVEFIDTANAGIRICVNLSGWEGDWTQASGKVREGHSYGVEGYDGENCTGKGYGQPNSENADVPVGLSTDNFWYTPNFQSG